MNERDLKYIRDKIDHARKEVWNLHALGEISYKVASSTVTKLNEVLENIQKDSN